MIVEKPWGGVVTYALNQPSSVRVITVEPGQETSVHYHRMRDETWVVLDPGLSIEIGDRTVDAGPGEEFVIPAEQPHRIRCNGSGPAGSSRWRTATRPRTTRSASRTRTGGPRAGLVRPIDTGQRLPLYSGARVPSDPPQAPAGPVLRFRRE